MKKAAALLWIAGVAGGVEAFAQQNINMSLSPKLVLRSSAGTFKNVASKNSKSVPSLGGLNVAFHYFLTPSLSAGIGYKAEFDIVRSTLPFKGFDVSGRWYPFSQGTYYVKRFDNNMLEFHESFASYLVADFSQRSYLLAKDGTAASVSSTTSEADILKGGFAAVNVGIGGDWRLSRHFEFNLEAITTIFALASTDPSVRLRSSFLNMGVSYVW